MYVELGRISFYPIPSSGHIVLQYWSTHPTETPLTIPTLQTVIPRSAQHPLDIVYELVDNDKQDNAVQVFSMVLEESYRWKSIVFQIPLILLEQMSMSLVECHFNDYEHPVDVIDIPHPIHLPNVRRLFVSSSRLLSYLRLPSLDKLIICHLNEADGVHGGTPAMNEFVHRSRCSLTSLSIRNSIFLHQKAEDCLLLMDSLVSLEIRHIREATDILDALATSLHFLPNLQHLSLLIPTSMEPSLWNQLNDIISSTTHSLRSIQIFCDDPDDAEWIKEHLTPLQPPELSMIVSWQGYIDPMSLLWRV
ncbi:hypothetical protein EDD18DRAFT_1400747 [Armillaria luteobubalina]|uniref:Uncharacterized protein n=1 Tax=Armillaria luteobubalina TaxID=153913 RepID=A0AA39TM32_9AGAR|nr:hypothetical protein EDD18DRAFT_1400747 [Armillaria luteobubalina]